MTDRRKKSRWEDKTPAQPVREKSGAALNLLDLAASVTRLARTYDQADRDDDGDTRALVGVRLIKLGGELAQAGWAIGRDEKKRRRG